MMNTRLSALARLSLLYSPAQLVKELLLAGVQSHCHHDFTHTRSVLAQQLSEAEIAHMLELLQEFGAHCDCEVNRSLQPDSVLYLLGDPRDVCYTLQKRVAEQGREGSPFVVTQAYLRSVLPENEIAGIIRLFQSFDFTNDHAVATTVCQQVLFDLHDTRPPIEIAVRCIAIVRDYIETQLPGRPEDYQFDYYGIDLDKYPGCHVVLATHQEDLHYQAELALEGKISFGSYSSKSREFYLAEEPAPLHVEVCGAVQ